MQPNTWKYLPRKTERTPIPPLWFWVVMLIVFAGLPFAASGLEAAWTEYNHNLIHMQGAW